LRKQPFKLRRWAECSDGTELPERDGKAEGKSKKAKVKRKKADARVPEGLKAVSKGAGIHFPTVGGSPKLYPGLSCVSAT